MHRFCAHPVVDGASLIVESVSVCVSPPARKLIYASIDVKKATTMLCIYL
jgi:hypothetical protein